MIRIYESVQSDAPFDIHNTGMSYYNDIMKDSEKDYYRYEKLVDGDIIYLTPKEYMDICTKDVFDGVDAYRGVIPSKVDDYAQKMRDGETFPMPTLEIQDGYVGQEGRHRMLSAGKVYGNDTKFPVLYVHNTTATKQDAINHLKKKWGKYYSDDEIPEKFDKYLKYFV